MSSARSRSGGSATGNDVQPVVEILAELPARDHLREVAVGRRDDAHVDADRLVAADALELALLQHAQQLDLGLERQLADLVEEQRAAVRQLEAALVLADRAGERALLVAEQLALDEAGGDRGAVHLDEQALAPRAGLVDRARDQLLAGAGLARDEDGGVRARDHRDPFLHVAKPGGRCRQSPTPVSRPAELAAQVVAVAGQLLFVALAIRDVLEEERHARRRRIQPHLVKAGRSTASRR